MIEDGEIFASINQKDGMVSFHDNPEKYNNPAMLHNIDQEMLKCIELDERLKAMDQEIKGFSVALMPVPELALVDQAGLELIEIHLPLTPKFWWLEPPPPGECSSLYGEHFIH
ncbi:COP9 signalosome complex subunit 3 [Microtus ochrogaster]|uniref:COP9 signalosome complex subunit 3 n=1 Tax=Microtus ochrogaster TaxID=79684 RepID=A0A8J6G0X7_MICOH|nr:COP9 signalosome complex subunit 3 [Microtus ochrogaster]